MAKSLFISLLILLSGLHINAQNTFSITGTVRDQKETLPGAGIYISGYKIATQADNNGKFTIPNLKPGSYDILVQMVGYLPYSKSLVISDKSLQVELVLKENTVTLNEVVIRADPNRAKYIQQFKEYFIGTSPNAAQCKILNPQVLNIDYDITKSLLTVKTTEFLIVENKALGYRLKYMLDYFEFNSRTRIIYFSGHPFFEELKSTNARRKKYQQLREVAYYGSSQHFFKSLYSGSSQKEGFVINKMVKIPNPNRYPDSVINKTLTRLRTLPKQSLAVRNPSKLDTSMISFWRKQQEMPRYIDHLDQREILPDTLVHFFNKNLKYLSSKEALAVIYTKEREPLVYGNTGFYIFRPLNIPDYEISVANIMQLPLRFYENGGVHDSRSLLYEGFWAYEKVADMVPMDYVPLKKL
ncbi:MAG: carboxypeptidase-like regulatory domain-containing protein [Bacteroidota bacterium]